MIYNEVTWNRLVDHDMVMVWDTCIPMAQTSCSLLELYGLCLYSQTMVGLCGLIWVTWGRDRAARPAIGWLGRAGLCAVYLGCKWAVAGLRPIEESTSVTQSNGLAIWSADIYLARCVLPFSSLNWLSRLIILLMGPFIDIFGRAGKVTIHALLSSWVLTFTFKSLRFSKTSLRNGMPSTFGHSHSSHCVFFSICSRVMVSGSY